MMLNRRMMNRAAVLLSLMLTLTVFSARLSADSGICSGQMITLPFTDVAGSPFFCQIASAFFTGLTNGTTATTYSPGDIVNREQMAAFMTRTLDQSLKRGSRRAALNQWAYPSAIPMQGMTTVGNAPGSVQCDGQDLWVANFGSDEVSRVRASDGRLLETWTGAMAATGVLVARGRIYVTARTSPGQIYMIDPKMPAGPVTLLTSNLGNDSRGITTDGTFLWVANAGGVTTEPGSVSRVNPDTGEVTTFTKGFQFPFGILYDGANIWVTDNGAGTLLKLNSDGTIAQTVTVGIAPRFPVFDGTNIWVPRSSGVTVVRASTGAVLATLNGNGDPLFAAFNGEHILVTNPDDDSVSLFRAVDLIPLGSFAAPNLSSPGGVCSDGVNFWISLNGINQLARF